MAIIFNDISSLKSKESRKRSGLGELCGGNEALELFDVSEKTLSKYRRVGIVRTHGIGGPTNSANRYYRHILLVQAQLKEDLIQTVVASGRPKNEWIGDRSRACCGQGDEFLIQLLNERRMTVGEVVDALRDVLRRVHESDQEMPVERIAQEVETLLERVAEDT